MRDKRMQRVYRLWTLFVATFFSWIQKGRRVIVYASSFYLGGAAPLTTNTGFYIVFWGNTPLAMYCALRISEQTLSGAAARFPTTFGIQLPPTILNLDT